jgi:hypothetical protein
MVSRDLAVVFDEDVCALASDGDLAGFHLEAPASERAVSYDQVGHSNILFATLGFAGDRLHFSYDTEQYV